MAKIPTVQEQAGDYLRTLARSSRTRESYAWCLKYFSDCVGDTTPLTHQVYMDFLSGLPAEFSPSTKRQLASAVTGLYNFAETGDPARMKTARKHYLPKVVVKPVNYDEIEIRNLIFTLSNPRYLANRIKDAKPPRKKITKLQILRDRLFVLMICDGGFRISEALSLKRGDIDWQRKRTLIIGKGEKYAFVYFSPRVLKAMKEYLDARSDLDDESGKPRAQIPLFVSHDIRGKYILAPIGTFGMRKSIHSYGYKGRIHDLRHYFVTMAYLKSGHNIKLAQELGRHASIQTTQRYTHLGDTDIETGYRDIFKE